MKRACPSVGVLAIAATIAGAVFLAFPAYAGQAEARETARMNNCAPKKIEVYRQTMGEAGETVYRVECNLPKMVDATLSGTQTSALLVSCVNALCHLLRPVEPEKK